MGIIRIINNVYHKGECSYLLFNYVKRDHWIVKLKEYFSRQYIDNLTDFNYSKCFSMFINISDVNSGIGTESFRIYIEKNLSLYGIIVEISAMGPYCIIKYTRYYWEKGEVKLEHSNIPYCSEHYTYDVKIKQFVQHYNLNVLDDEMLMKEVYGVELELKEPPVSVYNCLFEDSYSYYPYGNKSSISFYPKEDV